MPESVWMRFDRLARALLPVHERKDAHVVVRTRVGVATIAIFLVVAAVRIPTLLATGPVRQAVTLATCAALALLALAMPRLLGSFKPAAHVIVALVFVSIVGLVHETGGAVSPGLLVLLIVPMIAVFLTGPRGGTAWSLLAGAVILGYAVADRLGVSPDIRFTPETWKQAKSVGAFVLTMASLGVMLAFERARRLADQEAKDTAAEAERRVAASDAEHSQSLEWLSTSLAHEANNALAYVVADLADVGSGGGGRSRGALARVGAGRLRDLVRDVRTLMAPAAGSAPGDVVDVVLIVDAVVREVRPLFDRLGIKVERVGTRGMAFVRTDADAVARCLAAALVACAPDSTVEIRIEDAGAQQRAVIIKSKNSVLEARPLAVAAAQRALGALGGGVLISSDGGASTLRIELAAATAPKGALPAPIEGPPSTRLRVLVIDDEPAMLRATKRLLARHDVTLASSPQAGLAQIDAQRFDVILCDFNMPEMTGDEVLRRAVAAGVDPHRFVLVTGGAPGRKVMGMLEELGAHVLHKPYAPGDLDGLLKRVHKGRSAQ